MHCSVVGAISGKLSGRAVGLHTVQRGWHQSRALASRVDKLRPNLDRDASIALNTDIEGHRTTASNNVPG